MWTWTAHDRFWFTRESGTKGGRINTSQSPGIKIWRWGRGSNRHKEFPLFYHLMSVYLKDITLRLAGIEYDFNLYTNVRCWWISSLSQTLVPMRGLDLKITITFYIIQNKFLALDKLQVPWKSQVSLQYQETNHTLMLLIQYIQKKKGGTNNNYATLICLFFTIAQKWRVQIIKSGFELETSL